MELSEIDVLVGELETRVDRLRALYDQYFMGIEKLEPQVPRKDVDRRIHVLRKEQIRNTGLRFRFQMILQRYNTYQSYWARICRQIEDGTYKRHMMRAQARFGDVTAASLRPPAPEAPQPTVPIAPPGRAVPGFTAAELAELEEAFGPMDIRADSSFGVLDDPLAASGSNPAIPRPILPEPPPSAPRMPAAPGKAPPLPAQASRSLEPPKADPSKPQLWRKAAPAAPPTPQPVPVPARPAPPPVPRPAPAAAAPPQPPPLPKKPPPLPARAAVAPPPPSQPAQPSAIPEERVRQLYTQYVETKRKQNESTAAVTYDGLARSLRESSVKLREKHGRPVDFEVAVKDGKTIIRPIVK